MPLTLFISCYGFPTATVRARILHDDFQLKKEIRLARPRRGRKLVLVFLTHMLISLYLFKIDLLLGNFGLNALGFPFVRLRVLFMESEAVLVYDIILFVVLFIVYESKRRFQVNLNYSRM